MFLRKGWFFSIALVISSIFFSATASAQTQVSTSIKPLQLIAAAITDGVSVPILILGAEQDPHHASLRPSQRRALAQADLLLWVGPAMESALSKVIVERDEAVITAIELESLQKQILLNAVDPHLWLDTSNALLIAKTLTEKLIYMDVTNSHQYQANLAHFEMSINELNSTIKNKLAQQNHNGFAVYHNAFQYYEAQFGLQHVVSFTDDEELKPGIRKLRSIRAALQENSVSCILVEPSVNTESLGNIIDNAEMRYVSIDVMGFGFLHEKNAYIQFMNSLTDSVIECLR